MDRKEFETLATRLRPRLIEMACRCLGNHDDADDVAQDTLLKLWSMKSRLDEYKSIDALAIVIGRHLCLDRLKRAKTQPLDESLIDEIISSPEDVIIRAENDENLNNLINTLPDGQQIILRLKHIEMMETSEIAQMIGSTEVAVRVQLSRARNRIKELFLRNAYERH